MIFIIEDDKIMAECIARACKDYETKTFFNAIEAMADIDRNMPDLIFLDTFRPRRLHFFIRTRFLFRHRQNSNHHYFFAQFRKSRPIRIRSS